MNDIEEKIKELQIQVNGLLVEECHLRAQKKKIKEKREQIEKEILNNNFVLSGKTVKKSNQLNLIDEIKNLES